MDLAKNADSRNWRLDPIIRSLLDTDFYILLMQQFIYEKYPNVQVTKTIKCRTKDVKLRDFLDAQQLQAQLNHARSLRYKSNELVWLAGQKFYGETGIFNKAYLETLATFSLPDYKVQTEGDDWVISFTGPWWQVMAWEVPALAIVSELRTRHLLQNFTYTQLDVTYARAKVWLHDKLDTLALWRRRNDKTDGEKYPTIKYPDLNITDFGTRRRHSFLWQEYCVLACRDVLGAAFTGTSNVYLAYKHGLEPRGTNAHELPMVMVARARNQGPQAMVAAQYEFMRSWHNYYPEALSIMLPDAYGTTQFLANAPQELSFWRGARPDSKEPVAAGNELLAWWRAQGVSPEGIAKKLIIFSDGMDIIVQGAGGHVRKYTASANFSNVLHVHEEFSQKVQVGFGIGTNLTNDFWACAPLSMSWRSDYLKALSLVCKVTEVDGQPAVKLSDNPSKATGQPEEVEYYKQVFGVEGSVDTPVTV
jgi:nicotinate phosphoribosyltransferase